MKIPNSAESPGVSRARRRRGDLAMLKTRITEEAGSRFLSCGFVGTTTDEISSALGISKSTLYKIYPGKEAILRDFVRKRLKDTLAGIEWLLEDRCLGFFEKLSALLLYAGLRLNRFEPILVRDLKRHVPRVWEEIEDFRRDKIHKIFKAVLRQGRRQGYLRSDVDLDLFLAVFLEYLERFADPAAAPSLARPAEGPAGSIVQVFFQGILTDEGRRQLLSPGRASKGSE